MVGARARGVYTPPSRVHVADVVALATQLQMVRIAAQAVVALVTNDSAVVPVPLWYRAECQLPCGALGPCLWASPAAARYDAIPMTLALANPRPAFVRAALVNKTPEPLGERPSRLMAIVRGACFS